MDRPTPRAGWSVNLGHARLVRGMPMEPTVTKYPSGHILGLAKKEADRAEEDGSSAVIALFLAATSFEAFLNDLADFVMMLYRQDEPWELRAFAEICALLEEKRQSVMTRLEVGIFILSHEPVDRGSQPFQDFDLLMALRNGFVHKRPESAPLPSPPDTDELKPHRLVSRLADRKVIEAPEGSDAPFLLQYLETPTVAQWAISTVLLMGAELLQALPPSNTASAANGVFVQMRPQKELR